MRFINRKANFKTIEEQTVREKYELIDRTLNSKNNVLTVSYLLKMPEYQEVDSIHGKKGKNDLSSTYNKKRRTGS